MSRSTLSGLLFVALAAPDASAASDLISRKSLAADLTFIQNQASKTLQSLTPGGAPPTAYPRSGGETGAWKTVSASDWTSGFFPGELWLLYQATGQQQWMTAAANWTTPLASQATRTDTHDVGFIIGESFGNAYRLTGDSTYKSEILTAASSLATSRYSQTVGAVRSWSWGPWQYPVIIDNMMTLGPLQWGATNGGDPNWGTDATTHAQTTMKYLVRSDGSTYELADFNPTTGAFLANYTWAGLSVNSTWSRGEAWALYGFTQAYLATGNRAFLTTAAKIATYFFNNLPSDFVPYWDFNATPGPTTPRDTSAAAIAADAFIMLSTIPGKRQAVYLRHGEEILNSLTKNYLAPASGEAVLTDGTGSGPGSPAGADEVDTALIWGDYFFTEALVRLQERWNNQPGWNLYTNNSVAPELARPLGSVPEPSTWTAMLIGFAALGFVAYRGSRRSRNQIGSSASGAFFLLRNAG
jgi:unsaturated chondroitin disaccharide hydrolase